MRYATAAGVAAVIAGFVVLLDAGIAGLFDLSYVAVTLVGALAAVQGLRYAASRRHADCRSVDVGTPERRVASTVPGDDADRLLARVSATGRGRHNLRNRLRRRVRAVAVAEVADAWNCSSERASDLVATGEWTDDPAASAFLGDGLAYPARERFRTRLFGDSLFERGFAAALSEVDRLVDDPTGARREVER